MTLFAHSVFVATSRYEVELQLENVRKTGLTIEFQRIAAAKLLEVIPCEASWWRKYIYSTKADFANDFQGQINTYPELKPVYPDPIDGFVGGISGRSNV